MIETLRLKPGDLTRDTSQDPFGFETTADLEPLDQVIGQHRAVEAIDFGLNMAGAGYHIFVSGVEGTGKTTITREILKDFARLKPTPGDLCLVHDFADPHSPATLEMPTGSAVFFSRRMEQFVAGLKEKLPRIFEGREFGEKQQEIRNDFAQAQQRRFEPVEARASQMGIGIVETEQGYQPVPMAGEEVVSAEDFNAWDPDRRAAMESALSQVGLELSQALKEIKGLAQKMHESLAKAAVATAMQALSAEIDLLFSDYKAVPQVLEFLKNVKGDLAEYGLPFLLSSRREEGEGREGQEAAALIARRYQVNVLLDRRGEAGAPVVFEPTPSFQNLFGKVGQFQGRDELAMVQAGSLLKADQGYLILEVDALLRNPLVWETLKHTLQHRTLVIQEPPEQVGLTGAALRTRPIPVDVKVVLIGGYEIFRALQGADPKFNKIFKVRADFDHEAPLTPQNLVKYARFVARVCRDERLLPFQSSAVTAVVGFGSRMAEDQRRLSLRFGQVVGLLKEADYWARKEKSLAVAQVHVQKALNAYRFRHNLYEEKVQERYDDQSILMDVAGAVVGQVNALAVYQLGEISFGRPSRITAETYMGKTGIVNVEREAELSGQTHDKGVMIIAGYLGRMFAQNHPLSVSISITFEQSYSGVDGDSASSTELYAVLSSLSDLPIRQGIAVTGSVNQKGQIQAIGGVNEKVEGFFDICLNKGLTGDQGVMIPAANVNNLMLRQDVVEAVEQGRFHIYQVRTIEEGIEVLTGVAAGVADKKGIYPEKTLFGAVQAKLGRFYERSVKFSG